MRRGFTLVELVVVILILAVLVAVAAPRVIDAADDAAENSLKHSLERIRDAIAMYEAANGALPGADGTAGTFKADLAPYFHNSLFPASPLGPTKGDRRVRMLNDGDPLQGNVNPNRAWKYDYTTGEFIFNWREVSKDGATKYSEF